MLTNNGGTSVVRSPRKTLIDVGKEGEYGTVSGLKADLGSVSVVSACGCTIRRNNTNNYT